MLKVRVEPPLYPGVNQSSGKPASLFLHAVPLTESGEPALPHSCDVGYFHILPGEMRSVECSATVPIVSVRIDGWNVFSKVSRVADNKYAMIV